MKTITLCLLLSSSAFAATPAPTSGAVSSGGTASMPSATLGTNDASDSGSMGSSGQATDSTTGMTAGAESRQKHYTTSKKPSGTNPSAQGAVHDNLGSHSAAPMKNPAAVDQGEPSGAMGTVSPAEASGTQK